MYLFLHLVVMALKDEQHSYVCFPISQETRHWRICLQRKSFLSITFALRAFASLELNNGRNSSNNITWDVLFLRTKIPLKSLLKPSCLYVKDYSERAFSLNKFSQSCKSIKDMKSYITVMDFVALIVTTHHSRFTLF